MNHTSFYGKCEELASNRALCRQSADDGKNPNYKTAKSIPQASRPLLLKHACAGKRRESHERRQFQSAAKTSWAAVQKRGLAKD